ncbi:hypothetical protein [Methanocella arvoryzae]|uniref:Uncharacterized protein n=1 Tax=Methanocella arvoryzae (strain DSM 22066 / NBRC 105507 / MRE50) TaxID=351160 RepID=Q0W325_METAR|nr:hypothetical protein [Methanocella arvoryzae]CAJ37218.1 hypothetical protein RCIX2078 [Methanocella arvoryzae MRE50]
MDRLCIWSFAGIIVLTLSLATMVPVMDVLTNAGYSEEDAIEVARAFIIHYETYESIGVEETLRVYIDNSTPQVPGRYNVTVEFVCRYTGYGHRNGGVASFEAHKGYVIVSGDKVIDARLDDYWDMIKEERVEGKLYPVNRYRVFVNISA